jgi:hypothetical protein
LGLSFLNNNGATIKKMPLINVLASSAAVPAVVLEIHDCTEHMTGGEGKDAPYTIADLFLEHFKTHDENKCLTDLVFFDGARNVQKAGKILKAKYPCVTSLHGAEHCISLFFTDIAKISAINVSTPILHIICFALSLLTSMLLFVIPQVLVWKVKRLYRVCGSGSSHDIHAQFMNQSALANKGRKIFLLKGADTQMASFFYAMHRALRLRQPLLAIIYGAKFGSLQLTGRDKRAVIDIEDGLFWKATSALVRSIFSPLRALCFSDSNKPVMVESKIIFLAYRT